MKKLVNHKLLQMNFYSFKEEEPVIDLVKLEKNNAKKEKELELARRREKYMELQTTKNAF